MRVPDAGSAVWWASSAAAASYGGLFLLTGRPVAIRPGRLAWAALAAVAVRLVLAAIAWPLSPVDRALAALALLAAAGLWLARGVWLVRAAEAELRDRVETACRGLFLGCEERGPGRFRLAAREEEVELRIWRLGRRVLLLKLPPVTRRGKIALLVSWLKKQYPGPVPPVRIVARRRQSQ